MTSWREQIKKNERKTRLVIATFFLIYIFVGLLVDVTIVISSHSGVTLAQACQLLLTFKLIPYATIILLMLAFVSVMITYAFYNKIMLLGTSYHEVKAQGTNNLQEKKLYNVVEEMKVAAGLNYMPRIYIIDAEYMNAFASGFSEKSAMVAITKGLMDKLDRSELQAVMAHELSHIRHHDIKLTLMVAVLSNILLVVIDILFYSMIFKKNSKRQDNRLFIVIIVLRYALPLITLLLSMFLSRTREYMADAGCVELMRDNTPMGRALLKISGDHKNNAKAYAKLYGDTAHEQVRQAAYLYNPAAIDPVKSLSSAFATHPAIKDRLAAIGFTKD